MPAYIDHIIPQSNWERIRDQIVYILQRSFTDQVYYFQNEVCREVTFWAERMTPISEGEAAIIIINTFKGAYDNKSIGSTHGTYTYVIDFMANRSTVAVQPGDKLASHRLQKLMRTVRYILEHQLYITLGFTAPDAGIEHTEVTGWQIYKDDRATAPSDAMNTAVGQILFTVRCEETTIPNGGILLERSETTVSIEETDNGFQYTNIQT